MAKEDDSAKKSDPTVSEPKPEGATASATQVGSTAEAAKTASAIDLLKADHRTVEGLFAQYESADEPRKPDLIAQICRELIIHTELEERLFYPACRRAASEQEPLDEAQVEHDSAKVLIADLLQRESGDQYRDAKVSVLAEQIKHHVSEEEEPTTGIFANAKKAGVDTPELAAKLTQAKEALQARGDQLPRPHPVSFHSTPNQQQEDSCKGNKKIAMSAGASPPMTMIAATGEARRTQRNYRDDDDGRGWHGDPEGHSRAARGESSRNFAADDDRDGGRRSQGRNGGRDEEGRFTSGRGSVRANSDDDRGGRYGSRDDDGRFISGGGRDYDDDRGRGGRSYAARDDEGRFTSRGGRDDDDRGGRGRGGWFGDPQGHSEASRRGWDDREGSGRGRYADDDDRGSRGRNQSASRGDEGRFTSRGYRNDDRDRGHGGWFGDPEGHSEASRRGWEEREGSSRADRSEDDRRNSRSRNDDGRSHGGHGGWSGDPEGHAEAARRGWENRH